MTEANSPETVPARISAGLRRRHKSERRFRFLGIAAVAAALAFLAVMLVSIGGMGWTAFGQTMVRLPITFDAAKLDPGGTNDPAILARADYQGLVKKSLRDLFPDVKKRRAKRDLYALVSSGAGYDLRDKVVSDPSLMGTTRQIWLPASDDIDVYVKGGRNGAGSSESQGRLKDRQVDWIEALRDQGSVEVRFNRRFFTAGDSREPELAGILGAVMGSFFSLFVCLVLSFPVGALSAVYLEEFAPKNRWTELIEVNINNLAAVPSIVFGLLGLAIFLSVFGLPRSAPLVGGMVLALMTLPTIIIAGRISLKAVPPSIREAALAVGASPMQAVFHHVVPLAMPGMMTGTIIGMARALGETAPLLMIGMVAFIVDIPKSILDPATALPVQVFLWADSPERAFQERTAAAIIILLIFLISMNLVAIIVRKKFEQRW